MRTKGRSFGLPHTGFRESREAIRDYRKGLRDPETAV
jgi:hypothetical protein